MFNRNGEVVGMVSRSLRANSGHAGAGYAVHFGLTRDIELLTPNLDRLNPGWRKCWGVFASVTLDPISMHSTKEQAEAAASSLERPADLRLIAHRIGTADFVDLSA